MVQVPFSPQNWTNPELRSVPVEQFLAMVRSEKRDKIAEIINEVELPIDLDRSGWYDFIYFTLQFSTNTYRYSHK